MCVVTWRQIICPICQAVNLLEGEEATDLSPYCKCWRCRKVFGWRSAFELTMDELDESIPEDGVEPK